LKSLGEEVEVRLALEVINLQRPHFSTETNNVRACAVLLQSLQQELEFFRSKALQDQQATREIENEQHRLHIVAASNEEEVGFPYLNKSHILL